MGTNTNPRPLECIVPGLYGDPERAIIHIDVPEMLARYACDLGPMTARRFGLRALRQLHDEQLAVLLIARLHGVRR